MVRIRLTPWCPLTVSPPNTSRTLGKSWSCACCQVGLLVVPHLPWWLSSDGPFNYICAFILTFVVAAQAYVWTHKYHRSPKEIHSGTCFFFGTTGCHVETTALGLSGWSRDLKAVSLCLGVLTETLDRVGKFTRTGAPWNSHSRENKIVQPGMSSWMSFTDNEVIKLAQFANHCLLSVLRPAFYIFHFLFSASLVIPCCFQAWILYIHA